MIIEINVANIMFTAALGWLCLGAALAGLYVGTIACQLVLGEQLDLFAPIRQVATDFERWSRRPGDAPAL